MIYRLTSQRISRSISDSVAMLAHARTSFSRTYPRMPRCERVLRPPTFTSVLKRGVLTSLDLSHARPSRQVERTATRLTRNLSAVPLAIPFSCLSEILQGSQPATSPRSTTTASTFIDRTTIRRSQQGMQNSARPNATNCGTANNGCAGTRVRRQPCPDYHFSRGCSDRCETC